MTFLNPAFKHDTIEKSKKLAAIAKLENLLNKVCDEAHLINTAHQQIISILKSQGIKPQVLGTTINEYADIYKFEIDKIYGLDNSLRQLKKDFKEAFPNPDDNSEWAKPQPLVFR
jgi:hypothetical protein